MQAVLALAGTGDLKAVKELVGAGAPTDLRSEPSGDTALHLAAMASNSFMIETLVAAGGELCSGTSVLWEVQ